MTVEAALIKLGTAAVGAAVKLWLADHTVAAEVGSSAVDLLAQGLATHRDKRRLNRLVENFTEAVVDRLEPILDHEFRTLPANERLAAVEAVRDTFDEAALVESDLFAADLDARHLDKLIRGRGRDFTTSLSADGTSLYSLLLRECCGYVIEISRGLPRFSPSILTEILRRDTQILTEIRTVLARLPQRDLNAGFEYDYRQLVARKLDRVEIFGVTLAEETRKYPLSVAYISLTATKMDDKVAGVGSRVEERLSRSRRLFIRGEAGLGKTTLLQWIAVRSARSDFPAKLGKWNSTVPFLIPLRRYADRELPAPQQFVHEIGRHIAEEMPEGWVHDQLRSGRAIVLVDGVDELPADRREEARSWLNDLVLTFRRSRFVVTSRPGATSSDWLREDSFTVLDLQPMSLRDIRTFVGRWHEAIRSLCVDDRTRAELDDYEQGLIQKLNVSGHLRKLAGYPLLCALLCALHRDRRAALPSSRMELYDLALHMILVRRDAERKIVPITGLNYTEKILLLGDLAYWLIRNGRSDVEAGRATARLEERLLLMRQVQADPETVYRHLLERSGLLREPVVGRVDFIHQTFLEYLAARTAIVNADDVGQIVANAHLDQWHEVVIMSAGHANFAQRDELLTGLLARADAEPERRDAMVLLAMASLETSPELSPGLRAEIERRAATLLPPRSPQAAKSFASAGEFVLDLLANTRPSDQEEVIFTVRALIETGLEQAVSILERYSSDTRVAVQDELIRGFDRFDEELYGNAVLGNIPREEVLKVSVENGDKLGALRHLRHVAQLYVSFREPGTYDLRAYPDHVRVLRLSGPDNTRCRVGVGEVPALPNCHRVSIYMARVQTIELFGHLPRLQVLELYRCSIAADAKPSELPDLFGRLVELKVRHCGDIDLSRFGRMPALRRLDLTGTRVRDLAPLYELTQLRTLRFTTGSEQDADELTRALPHTEVFWRPLPRTV